MRIDLVGYAWRTFDGYGRYAAHLLRALQRLGVDAHPLFAESVNMPDWIKAQIGIQPGTLTVSCLPPVYLQDAPSGGRHWLITMTEGSELPLGWADIINKRNIERVIVPCEHNAKAFRDGGVKAPIHVIPGGTCPDEFPIKDYSARQQNNFRPYTFLALADRGARKGWCEVWSAFFKAFGTPEDTPDVRLIIKCRPDGNEMIDMIAEAQGLDPRIKIIRADMDMREFYAMGDCLAIPSRSEGWGMIMREGAMSGLPVITQCYSGMDDGYTGHWAHVIEFGKLEPIPSQFEHIKGEWMKANISELEDAMRMHYKIPEWGMQWGQRAAHWLRANQTWEHSAKTLLDLIQEHTGNSTRQFSFTSCDTSDWHEVGLAC